MEAGSGNAVLDRTFVVSVVLKGLDGLVEVLGGLVLVVVSPATLHAWAVALTQHELSRDPRDVVANHLLHATGDLASTRVFGAVYLISHGAVKIVLVAALLRRRRWAYPATLVFLVAFIAYQAYRMTFAPSFGLAALTVFDAFVVWLVWREYRATRGAEAPPPVRQGATA